MQELPKDSVTRVPTASQQPLHSATKLKETTQEKYIFQTAKQSLEQFSQLEEKAPLKWGDIIVLGKREMNPSWQEIRKQVFDCGFLATRRGEVRKAFGYYAP